MKQSTILILVLLFLAGGPPLVRAGEPILLNADELDHVSAGGVTVKIGQANEVSIATLGDVEVRVSGPDGSEGAVRVRVGRGGNLKLFGIDGRKVTIKANDDFAAILRKLERVHVQYRLEPIGDAAAEPVLIPGVRFAFVRADER